MSLRGYVLSNGSYSVLLTPQGGGYSALDGYALTRWSPDPARETQGTFCYLRDAESGEFWSITEAPRPAASAQGAAIAQRDRVEFSCVAHEIESRVRVVVSGKCNGEIRSITLTNQSAARRTIELTTYAELVLNPPAADAAHPAFSKLFVQTGYDGQRRALLAWRRKRSPHDRALWVAQRLVGGAALEYDTDRARFIGRARSVADPLGMHARLSGTIGTVLDPVLVQRTSVTLDAHQSAELHLFTVAGDTRDAVERALDAIAKHGPASAAADRALEALGLPTAWLPGITFDGAEHRWTSHTAPSSQLPPRPRADYGGFADDGSEYITTVSEERAATPQPWINVLANERFGCLLSERGAGYTWSQNSRENRITPWSNDPVCDPHDEALYVRDETDGSFWSILPGPAPAPVAYEVRHGFGYSRFLHSYRDLAVDTLVFVPLSDDVRLLRVSITNTCGQTKSLSLWSYAQLVLGTTPAETRHSIFTRYDPDPGIVFASNPKRGEFSERVAFAAACAPGHTGASATADRSSFLGHGGPMRPRAVADGQPLDGRFGAGIDACAAQRFSVEIAPGRTLACAFLLGEAEDSDAARACVAKYASITAIDAAAAETTSYWKRLLSAVHISTPAATLDLLANGWLAYQDLACRMWARSAFQQSGGAFGFRDQLQDSAGLLYHDPAITRAQIILHAAHQFVEGDVLHWWHPPLDKGIRTRFSDDLLWLPYITAFYIESTGDRALLDEVVRYITGPTLADDEDEIFIFAQDSGTAGTVYEHCCRALDRSLTRGAHGLPLMGVGDWNDGMNRVGREGRGESVWLGFFLFDILQHFIPFCDGREDRKRAEKYRSYQDELARTLNDTGWDGEWYRRAYYDDGTPLGSKQNDECRIDALAQAWAVLSKVAPPARVQSALSALRRDLIDENAGLIRLLAPPFDATEHDPGYIKGYVPGVRENGGQYTHAAIWAVRGFAEIGDREAAAALLQMLSPVSHTISPDDVLTYQGEPYVIAADVYGTPPHVGRAGWTWYTGSAGWMLRTVLESILGLRLLDGREIRLQPCIPDAWPGFTLRYRLPDGTQYQFTVERSDGVTEVNSDVDSWVENGAILIAIVHDGGLHEVHVRLGKDVGPVYEMAEPLLRTTSE